METVLSYLLSTLSASDVFQGFPFNTPKIIVRDRKGVQYSNSPYYII